VAGPAAAARSVGRRLPTYVWFWLLGGLLGLFLFAASAPSPLYALYQVDFGFTSSTLTLIFAVYAIALLATLLVAGSLSDYVGRRPVIIAALLVNVAATATFLVANGVGLLYLARILQGAATGAATGALSAGLLEMQPEGTVGLGPVVNSAAPTTGLAVGGLGAGALVEYGPDPTHLVFWLLLVAFIVGIAGVLAMPESGTRRPGAVAALRPRVGIPQAARATFVRTLPCLVALWALGGFYLSLGPSLAAQMLESANHLWGGLVIFLLTGLGAAASTLLRRSNPQTAMVAGCATLVIGVGATIVAMAMATAVVFLVGTAVAGVGFGLAFLGAFRTLSALATPSDRARLVTTIYIASYLAFSIPVVIAGAAANHFGLHATAMVYAAVVAGLAALALTGSAFRRAAPAERPHPAPTADLPPSPCTVPHCVHTRPAAS
jgi:hypothetical protein